MNFQDILSSPLYLILGIVIIIVLVVGLFVGLYFYAKRRKRKKINKIIQNYSYMPEFCANEILKIYPAVKLADDLQYFEKLSVKYNLNFFILLGLDSWMKDRLIKSKSKKDFLYLLNHSPDNALFTCFLIALEKPPFMALLLQWLEEHFDVLYLRNIAISGKGEPFSGKKAYDIFKDKIEQVREMLGDPEWKSRYFALRILLSDNSEVTVRLLWDLFSDSHALVRRTLIENFTTEESDRFYDILLNILTDDPAFEVRLAAWNRLIKDFSAKIKLDSTAFNNDQIQHILELLTPELKENEAFAMNFLTSDNDEILFYTLKFLHKTEALKRLFLDVDFGNRENLENNLKLLKNAAKVDETSFLEYLESTDNPASFYIAANILLEKGDRKHLTTLAKKVFNFYVDESYYKDLYQLTVECICKHGDDKAIQILSDEMHKKRDSKEFFDLICSQIPVEKDYIFFPTLYELFINPDFQNREPLNTLLCKINTSLIVPRLLNILEIGRAQFPHKIRIEAVKVLGMLKLTYCLQHLLEFLPTLPIDDAKEFAEVLSQYPEKMIEEKIEKILHGYDGSSKQAVILTLPLNLKKKYQKIIRESLSDSDPQVRIASIIALIESNESKILSQSEFLLNDPVAEVRNEAARALAMLGDSAVIESLTKMVFDEKEVDSIKLSIIHGLQYSSQIESVSLLVKIFNQYPYFATNVQKSLLGKAEKKFLKQMVEEFKDGTGEVKTFIADTFKKFGSLAEPVVLELLEEDISSLKPYLTEILQKTGYIDLQIRKLNHKDVQQRRSAAEILSLIATTSAFRGLVLSAKDPDEQVRIMTIRALEKLESRDSDPILEELLNDPDKKVRKFTQWAVEKLKAKMDEPKENKESKNKKEKEE